MISGIRQLREHRAHDATGGFAIPGYDGSPLVDWDLDGVEGLGPALAAQFALAGSPEIADPVGSSIRQYQMTAPPTSTEMTDTLRVSPVRRPTRVKAATPRAFSLMASGLASRRMKAGDQTHVDISESARPSAGQPGDPRPGAATGAENPARGTAESTVNCAGSDTASANRPCGGSCPPAGADRPRGTSTPTGGAFLRK
jgi:hypothetical protein